MERVIGWLIQENSAKELAKALAFVNPEAILESDQDGIYTVIAKGMPVSFVGQWESKPMHSTGDMYKLASAIQFANPAAAVVVSRYRVNVRYDYTVKNPITEVIVMGRHALELPEGFISVGNRDIQFPDDPAVASIMFGALLDECAKMRVGLLMQNVPSVIAGAVARMHNREECPTVLATINGNRAPMGEKPVFVLSKIYNIVTNKVVWELE